MIEAAARYDALLVDICSIGMHTMRHVEPGISVVPIKRSLAWEEARSDGGAQDMGSRRLAAGLLSAFLACELQWWTSAEHVVWSCH